MAEQLSSQSMAHVEQVTVRLPCRIGRGVLILGGFILTAARCIEYENGIKIRMSSDYLEPVETYAGSLKASPIFIEFISNIAVLAEPDSRIFFSDQEAYSQWCRVAQGVPIYKDDLPSQTPVPVAIFTQSGWISGQICWNSPYSTGTVVLEPQGSFQRGDCGSPVVTLDGRLVGILSAHKSINPSGDWPLDFGKMAWLAQMLPAWLLRIIPNELT